MCKRGGLLIGMDRTSKRALVTDGDCESWSCPECSRRMTDNWILRAEIGVRQYLRDGNTVDFCTITSHEKLTSFEATERVWRQAWPTLYNALKRQNTELQYFTVPEKHKDGRMHVHTLWTAGVSQRWLKDNARKRGLGHQAKLIPITDVQKAVNYVTKYVGKDLGADVPKRFRRVRVSQGWPTIPKPETELNGLDWLYVRTNAQLVTLYDLARIEHLTLIDLKSGEIFDDVDLDSQAI